MSLEMSSAAGSQTETVVREGSRSPRLRLTLTKPKNNKKVKWTTETVDNEHMDKKKSKCCCIYEKPKLFGESSSEEDDDSDGCGQNCRGHKKKCYKSHAHQHKDDGENIQDAGASGGPSTAS
ncbi:E3 ubiquitin-protein ligase PPP1R11-like [Gigantopelta aegis]|uniref:E3 ubiquitin-protein ligase PPP1R11-like n=1 Tax=Gigantopelta aegis TaxID=1735272 RepID=UPI001B88964D|nr:E3 ubiquitin-protein ligase PPP1R11-like [Gigantopelta aegis]